MKTLMRYVRRLLVGALLALCLLVVSIEAFSFYRLSQLGPEKVVSEVAYSQALTDAQWVSIEGGETIGMNRFWSSEYVFDFLLVAIGDYKDYRSSFPKGTFLAAFVSRDMLSERSHEKPFSRISDQIIVSAWVSRNFSADEALKYLLDSGYFGHEIHGASKAAEFYFGKEPAMLDFSESIALVAISRSPSRSDPRCYPDWLARQAGMVVEKLKKFDTLKYGGYSYQPPLFLGHDEVVCTP